MEEDQLFEHSLWLGIAVKGSELQDNLEGAAHLVERFVAQYLPAALQSSSDQSYERVWLAFWHYLVAPMTRRKPFGLSGTAADELIAEYRNEIARYNSS